MASNDKSSWSIRPASPDSLSKKLKKCKSRKERQEVFLLDQIEREERRRAEKAHDEAARVAKELEEHKRGVNRYFADMGWTVDEINSWWQRKADEKNSRQVVRSPKERLQRAVLVKPEPPKEPVNLARRYGVDPTHFNITRHEEGKVRISAVKRNSLIPAVVVDDNIVMTERYALYLQLQKMNLQDPATVEKVRQACASPQKAEDKSEDPPKTDKSPKRKLFRNK